MPGSSEIEIRPVYSAEVFDEVMTPEIAKRMQATEAELARRSAAGNS
jgi:hypothetical protein